MELMEHQLAAIDKLDNGKILYGNVGDGKSVTALGYYAKYESPKDIYVITTGKKRDSWDWTRDATHFDIGHDEESTRHGILTVDSWQQLKHYTDVKDAFFIFDEQRLVGYGAWVKHFLRIAKHNRWILLSATPGDQWLDYAPIFIANGFYKNITEFKMQHVLYEPFHKYPKIRGYLNERKLEMLRNDVLVEMPFMKHTERHLNYFDMTYDVDMHNRIMYDRWNIYENRPVKDAAEMWRLLRKLVYTDPSRVEYIRFLRHIHPRLVIFYNFDYELELLRALDEEVDVYEWNGHKKHNPPDTGRWVYLVQYLAGAEGWNCTSTDAMVLYSLTYSYKNFMQSQGRIDRLNTPYRDLYYYILVSNSIVDFGVRKSLKEKRNFNERKFVSEIEQEGRYSYQI